MAESGFFVRMRGRISGPFEIETLRRMARTGALSRIHEISSDRTSWARASDYEDLFPMAGSTPARSDFREEPILTPIDSLDVAPRAPCPPPMPPRLPIGPRGPLRGNTAEPPRRSKTIYVVLLIVGLLLILCIGAAVAIVLVSSMGPSAPNNAPTGGTETPATK